ncbi:nicotinamide N-methyltransferase-like [Mixophyes fleayi]|uniref:nicotinamide N-methyltransferase-like n=1 Tax=Mixophyes fleayi TaxID=3061075 RepID=UPI003F4DB6CF
MDPSCLKYYHVHEFDAKDILGTYCSPTTERTLLEEMVVFPMKELQKLQASGTFRGGLLIDFSIGPIIFHLLPICDVFKAITVLETNDFCIKELESWINKEEEAFDWSHLSEVFPEMEGNSEKWMEKEETLRRKMKQIMKCDLSQENPTQPFVLEKADCLLSVYLLQKISKDKDTYRRNLKKLSSMIKVGGHLILLGGFNSQYFSVGDHKLHSLTFEEDFVREAVVDTGFTIEDLQILNSNVCSDIIIYGNIWFLRALKVREVL